MHAIAANFRTISPAATALSVLALVIILLTMRFVNRLPGYIVALLVGTGLAIIFKLPVETIGSRFGGIPSGLPNFEIPPLKFAGR